MHTRSSCYLRWQSVLHPIEQLLFAVLLRQLRDANESFGVRSAQLLFAGRCAQSFFQSSSILEAWARIGLRRIRAREIQHEPFTKPQWSSGTRVGLDEHVQQLVMDCAFQRARLAQHIGWLQLNGASTRRSSNPSWIAGGIAERGHGCVDL